MDCQIITRLGWKLLAVASIPLLILVIILIVNSSSGTSPENAAVNSDLSKKFASNLWPQGRVPYTIETYMQDAKVLIKNAMKVFQDKTCIKFEEKARSDSKWLNFARNDDLCTDSLLGMDISKKGEEEIQLGLDCLTAPILLKTIGRSLGLEYEESRPDRDKFITFVAGCKDNTRAATAMPESQNMSAISEGHNEAALEIFFDYASHMLNGVQCIRPLSSNSIKLGSSDDTDSGTLSLLDIEKINAIYNCPGCNSYRFRPISKVTESAHSFESYHPVRAGHDLDGIPFYICRVYHLGSLLIGKLKVTHEEDLCWIADNGKEYRYGRRYEVLTNPRNVNLTWVQSGTTIPSNAIRGGRTVDRQVLYIGRCLLQAHGKNSIIPSTIYPGNAVLKVPFAHVAQQCSTFEVLAMNQNK